MAVLAIQTVVQAGLLPAFVAAAGGGDTVRTDASKKRFVVVKNGGGGAITVTVDAIRACDQGFDHNGGGSVGAGAERWFGPLTPDLYGENAAVSYSGVTNVTVGAVEL